MNKRGQAAALNRQNNLNEFLDISAGSGTHAPRKSRAYDSKRLQQVISEFRRKKKQRSESNTPVPGSQTGDGNSQDESESMKEVGEGTSRKRQRTKMNGETAAKKKGRKTTASRASRGKGKSGTSSAVTRGRGRGVSGQTRTQARKNKAQESSSELSEQMDEDSDVFVPGPAKDAISETREVNLRLRPKPRPTYKGARDPMVEVTGGEASAPNPNVSNANLNEVPEGGELTPL